MIYVSLYADKYETCLETVRKYKYVEFRLDNTDFSFEQLNELFSEAKNCIATCKPGYKTDDERYRLLCDSLKAGAEYIDIDLKDQEDLKNKLISKARELKKKIIISYHNFVTTPDYEELHAIMAKGLEYGPDILKIACTAKSERDCARLLSLYDTDITADTGLITISMGELGTLTRAAALCLGAPLMYAAVPGETRTAPGQLDYNQLKKIIDTVKK